MSRALRVAWLGHTSTALAGGMATYSREVVARLRRRGHRVTFFQHEMPQPGPEAEADEAMACGAATIATDVGVDGDALRGAGLVLDPRRLDEQLRLALRMLIEMPWLAGPLGQAARRRVVERFSLERNVDALVDAYRELVA